jgi:hypothetical protein
LTLGSTAVAGRTEQGPTYGKGFVVSEPGPPASAWIAAKADEEYVDEQNLADLESYISETLCGHVVQRLRFVTID